MPTFRIRLYFQQKMFSGDDEWVKSCRQYSISFYSDSWMDETTCVLHTVISHFGQSIREARKTF